MFTNEIYNTPLGSFALTQALLNDKLKTDKDRQHFSSLYFKAKKKKWRMDDPQLLNKIATFFECEMKLDHICVVMSNHNMLFTFYVEEDDGNIVCLPNREDGYMQYTLKCGKVYKLENDKWSVEKLENN